MDRGIAGIKPFQAEADCEDFLGCLPRLSKDGHLQVCLWALGRDHFHPRKGDDMVADERILGGADFVEGLLAEAAESIRQTLRLASSR